MASPFSKMVDRLLGKAEQDTPRTAAKERLRLVIAADRTDITDQKMKLIVRDVKAAIARHIVFDESTFDVSLERANGTYALVASVPIQSVRKDHDSA